LALPVSLDQERSFRLNDLAVLMAINGKKMNGHCAMKLRKGGRDSNSETFRRNPAG
jgi:hypothetical protein